MNKSTRKKLASCKRKIRHRLREMFWEDQPNPMFSASNIHYELADRTRGIDCGGIGAIHLLARQTGLIDAIDRKLHLLKIHKPYHESDHVLNVGLNVWKQQPPEFFEQAIIEVGRPVVIQSAPR